MSVVDTLKSANEQVLACVGVNDIGVARLRLVLRLAAPQLKSSWRMGDIDGADLLVLAAGSPRADRVAQEAQGSGVRYLLLGGRRGNPGVLPVPFDVDDLAAALNADAPRSLNLDLLDSASPDFFLGDNATEPATTPASQRQWKDPVDLDEIFKRDPLGDRAEVRLPPRKPTVSSRLDELVPTVAPREVPAQRNPFLDDAADADPTPESPRKPSAAPFARHWQSRDTPRGAATDPARERRNGGNEKHALDQYLQTGLLVGPSRLQLPGQAELILDPKHRTFHIDGGLKAVEPYVSGSLPRDDWHPVTNTQLQRVRAACPGQSYVQLRWLFALRQSDGWLPRHLDPGGSYWLRQTLDLDENYDVYRRIGRVLMQSHRLHEVVKMADVTMQDVFGTVAAYDAIGLVQFTPRERLR